MDIVKMVLERTEMMRYCAYKKKPHPVVLSIRNETFEIVCNPRLATRPVTECVISFSEIKEIRAGKASKDFDTTPDAKKCDKSKCFVLYYGSEFLLKTLSICAESEKNSLANFTEKSPEDNLIQNLIQGLHILRQHYISYPLRLDIWLQKCFLSMNLNGVVTLKHMTNQYMNKICLRIPTDKLTELFEKFGEGLEYGIKYRGFSDLTKQFLHNQQIFTDCFGKYCLKANVPKVGFQQFLISEQQIDQPNISQQIMREYFSEENGELYLSINKAVDFLFSKENQIWNPKYDDVYQDMTHPLSHYWIASSHNTYLTGDQITSDSSVESYVRALRQGCRCIEIDCFDGTDGPVVYHGRTFTSKISFVDVLVSIRDNAFVTSEFPVIISIENHCSLKQQKVMAAKFIEIFGKMLITEPLQGNGACLPSPEELKGRIILKGRKLCLNDEKVTEDQMGDLNVSEAKKTGKMYLQNHAKIWEPFFFALMGNKLRYNAIDEPNQVTEREKPEPSFACANEELHFKEKWYHGDIPGGTEEAATRVKAYNVEGCFLVRKSTQFPEEYALCLLSGERAYHLRIASKYESAGGPRLFFLVPEKMFDSLYLLVTHYRRYPLDTLTFTIARFTTPVPPPENHENEPWFHKNVDRFGAESILANIPITGAFLVRYAGERSPTRFAISFRIDKLIKHCRINEDGRLLVISNNKFESLTELVNYYREHIFYKWVTLSPPVTPDLRRLSGDSVSPTEVMSEQGYMNVVETQARALKDFAADSSTKLSFKKGDVINNVEKLDGEFWKGDLGYQVQKLFPKEYVEVLETPESPFGTTRKGIIDVGEVQVVPNTDKNYPYLVIIASTPIPLKIAVKTEEEAREWEVVINEARSGSELRTPSKSKKSEKKSKIATELSQLIVYAGTMPKLSPQEIRKNGRIHNKLASFSETVGEKHIYSDPQFFVWLTQVQLVRAYPKGQRIDSSNYNPSTFWNVGCQLAAMNYQTPEKFMQINRGKFRQNGNCGYVLKPDFLLKEEEFNPNETKFLPTFNIKPVKITLAIISGRHVYKPDKGFVSPFVEVEIIGAPFDCQKIKSRSVVDNGLNPFWKDKFIIEVRNSALALIRFCVQSEDTFGDMNFIGEATYPISCLLPGYRSVPLLNGYGEELLATLLVHFKRDEF